MRSVLVLFLATMICGCSCPEPPAPEPDPPACGEVPECFGCAEAAACHAERCPETEAWCAAGAPPCPDGLTQTFCDGSPAWDSCVFVGHTVCDGLTAVFCCAGAPLGPEWFCDVAADCPPPTSECMAAVCAPLNGMPPGPNGEQMKCSYDLVPDGTPCALGVCQAGICQSAPVTPVRGASPPAAPR